MSRAVLYHCPACDSTAEEPRCPSCGNEGSDGEATWMLSGGAGRTPSGAEIEIPLPTTILEGGKFSDRYELIEQIGRGGMGVVYKAFDRELDEIIALKTLVDSLDGAPDQVVRFKNELKVARRLSHPNIARFHDLVEMRGKLYLSMEFIPGVSLRHKLNPGPMAPELVINVLRELLPALDLAHRHGVVHRDLKPGNIIIDPSESPHILDFGIATSQWTDDSSNKQIAGTPTYMAPEQWLEGQAGVKVDGRSDLYGLGVMAYEMLCGAPPFQHRNRFILMEMHRNRAPRRPHDVNQAIPRMLDELVLRLLAKDPAERFQRARDALGALMPEEAASRDARRVDEARSPQARGMVPPVKLMPGAKGKVLVADDDPQVRKTLTTQMRDLNVVVIECENGQQAVERSFREVPDLVMIDMNMPILDGLDVLRILKHDPRTKNTPVVMMSGRSDPAVNAFSRELGAATFLDKPLQGSVVELLVERYIGKG